MRPTLSDIDAVKTHVLRVGSKPDNHVGPGLKRSEPYAETHPDRPVGAIVDVAHDHAPAVIVLGAHSQIADEAP